MSKVIKAVLLSVLLVAFSLGGAVAALKYKLDRFGDTALAEGKSPAVRLTIPRGANTQAISAVLEENGVIRNARQFYLFTRFIRHTDHLLRTGAPGPSTSRAASCAVTACAS